MTPEFPRKLGVHGGARIRLLGAPPQFARALAEVIPSDCTLTAEGAPVAGAASPLDVVLWWVSDQDDLTRTLRELMDRLAGNGAVWAVIPKKKALAGRTGPTFNGVQNAALPLGLVDNKDLGFSDTEYGIRFVIRKELRPGHQARIAAIPST
jgi:hypothetical protein